MRIPILSILQRCLALAMAALLWPLGRECLALYLHRGAAAEVVRRTMQEAAEQRLHLRLALDQSESDAREARACHAYVDELRRRQWVRERMTLAEAQIGGITGGNQ